jgi:hypothetical protein
MGHKGVDCRLRIARGRVVGGELRLQEMPERGVFEIRWPGEGRGTLMESQVWRGEGDVGVRARAVQGGRAQAQRPRAGTSDACGGARGRGGARDVRARGGGGLRGRAAGGIVGANDAGECGRVGRGGA